MKELATASFKQTINVNEFPEKVVIDKIGAKPCRTGKILIPC
jgi:hypothetical protein